MIQQIPGIGPVLAAVFVAEIGDVHRFAGPAQLTCWAGLTPRQQTAHTPAEDVGVTGTCSASRHILGTAAQLLPYPTVPRNTAGYQHCVFVIML